MQTVQRLKDLQVGQILKKATIPKEKKPRLPPMRGNGEFRCECLRSPDSNFLIDGKTPFVGMSRYDKLLFRLKIDLVKSFPGVKGPKISRKFLAQTSTTQPKRQGCQPYMTGKLPLSIKSFVLIQLWNNQSSSRTRVPVSV